MNVINDPWLFVEYMDGSKKQVSVRQAFKDATKIRQLETPTFHNTKMYIYDVPVIQFLSVILLSAYFKPEQNYASGEPNFSKQLMKSGWNQKVIDKYLDKWQNRFNLFDDKHPFMQDITLKDKVKAPTSTDYIAQFSPIAPAGNNIVFETAPSEATGNIIQNYDMDETEIVYTLLYQNSMGTTIMAAQYPNVSLTNKNTSFMVLQGNSLRDTIIYNSLPLCDSERPSEYNQDSPSDKPVWELDSKKEVLDYELSKLWQNVLLCSFFPSLPVLLTYDNGLKNVTLSKTTDDSPVDKDTREELSNSYLLENPWAIVNLVIEKDDKKLYKPKEWTQALKIINLCIEITKKNSSRTLCRLVSPEIQENHNAKCFIYYREFDKYKCNVYSCGRCELNQDIFDVFQDEDNHKIAEQYQNILDDIMTRLKVFKNNSGLNKNKGDELIFRFSKSAEYYFLNTLVANIKDEDIIEQVVTYLSKTARQLVDKTGEGNIDPVLYMKAYMIFNGGLKKVKEKYLEGNDG